MITEVFRWVRLVAVAYLLVVLLLALVQRRLIYFPTRDSEEGVLAFAREVGLEPWRDASGALIGVFQPNPPGLNQPGLNQPGLEAEEERVPRRVLVFHGNAGFAAHRGYFARLFPERAVYILEYPGFGSRTGRPGEKTIRAAADEALAELMREDSDPVILVGESIGSGPASWLAGTRPDKVAGLLLITPFTSLADVAASQFPFFPVRPVLRDRWDNERHLPLFPGPVAFLLAEDDSIVPPRFGRALYEGYLKARPSGTDRTGGESGTAGAPGRLWTIPGTGHNEIIRDLPRQTWREILRYLGSPPDAP